MAKKSRQKPAGGEPGVPARRTGETPVPPHHRQHAADKTKVRHRRPTAHERARYRCFLPDLAGLAGKRRAEPMPDTTYYQEIAENRKGRSDFSTIIKSRYGRVRVPRLQK